MKTLPMTALAAALVGGFWLAHPAPAAAQDVNISLPGFNFSFNTGDVAFAYSDGYWDHEHHWHGWRDEREAREYRARYAERYDERRHDRVENEGWRDEHREGRGEERHDEHRDEHRDRDRDDK